MKFRIEILPLAGRFVVALKDPDSGDLVKTLSVNASAAEMIRLYSEGMDIFNIAQTLSEKYGVPMERIRTDAVALFSQLA